MLTLLVGLDCFDLVAFLALLVFFPFFGSLAFFVLLEKVTNDSGLVNSFTHSPGLPSLYSPTPYSDPFLCFPFFTLVNEMNAFLISSPCLLAAILMYLISDSRHVSFSESKRMKRSF